MRRSLGVLAFGLLAIPAVAFAQEVSNPVSAALKAALERAQRNLVAAAEEMPADKYGYKPTPAQMSFAQLVLHVAGSNEYLCAAISGGKAPERTKLAPTDPKDSLVNRLKASFDYCATALAGVDDSKMGESIPFFGGRQISRAGAMLDLAADWADHYSTAAGYLRLNGLLPPTARRRGQSD